MSAQSKPINTQTIAEMSRSGIPLTGDLETVLLNDPQSLRHKDFQAALLKAVESEIDLDNLAYQLGLEQKHAEEIEEFELAEEAAQIEYARQQPQQQLDLSPLNLVKSNPTELSVSALFIEFLALTRSLNATNQATQTLQANQQALRAQWQQQQQQNANHFVAQLGNTPLLGPAGQPIPLTLNFDPQSQEAIEMRQRLAAAPMTADVLETLTGTHMGETFRNEVKFQQAKILNNNPELKNDPAQLEFLSKQQTIFNLNMDQRAANNKYLISVPLIHKHLKAKGQTHIDDLVNAYNTALGIDPKSHRRVPIFKIINHSISPLLTPATQKKTNAEELDEAIANMQLLKMKTQQNHLEQTKRAQLQFIQGLLSSLHAAAEEDEAYSAIHDLCQRAVPSMNQQMRAGRSRR